MAQRRPQKANLPSDSGSLKIVVCLQDMAATLFVLGSGIARVYQEQYP
jgi:hypothetical protein